MPSLDTGYRITVDELLSQLRGLPGDTEITFGCTLDAVPLIFSRVKSRGDKLIQIELCELTPETYPEAYQNHKK